MSALIDFLDLFFSMLFKDYKKYGEKAHREQRLHSQVYRRADDAKDRKNMRINNRITQVLLKKDKKSGMVFGRWLYYVNRPEWDKIMKERGEKFESEMKQKLGIKD
jgi:hypothetical protein